MSDATPNGITEEPSTAHVPAPDGVSQRRPSLSPLAGFAQEVRDGDLKKPMGLTDFMFQLGFHYRLPGRQAATPTPGVAVVQRVRWWLPVAAVALLAVVAVRDLGSIAPARELPERLLGQWATDAPGYQDRRILFSPGTIRLEFGDSLGSAQFAVSEVRWEGRGDSTHYDIRYWQEGVLTRLRFVYVEFPVPSIRLRNPASLVWFPRETSSGPGGQESGSPAVESPEPPPAASPSRPARSR
jgi:hypothetical protein